MNISQIYRYFLQSTGVCTDTRKIKNGNIFIALKGDNFNGNNFVKYAFESGASFVIVDEKQAVINENCIYVEDGLHTLQKLANYHRNRFTLPVIAITGSNGKTTTKELIISVLKKKFFVHHTEGNFNNHIGVPLTLLNINQKHDISIIEMGANHQKEIESLCVIAEPDYGLITNVGKAHLEGFGGFEGVIKGKTELFKHIKEYGRLLFVNQQDDILMNKSKDIPRMLYGPDKNEISLVRESPELHIKWRGELIHTQLPGKYNFQNIQAAIAIGVYFRVEKPLIIQAIEEYNPDNSRSQVIKTSSNTIILDSYNANPTSVVAAIENLKQYQSKHKLKYVVLGDMLELGEHSFAYHKQILETLGENEFDHVLLVGPCFMESGNSYKTKFHFFEDSLQAAKYIEQHPPEDAVILIKGSRGIKMERILKALPA
ncbi:MAG: UDP-N-acetylmuramoyl-tripeptide--D-alanyl-D-alanine ligase [Bacteroidales bacterium]|nr:UDP-N-acetylmuramoyl-tripeptide--D-alanyl-D-alanine ligase [Bacteroidales bacterium]MCF8326687.1 UDP-N-acetylmuramoyl-tripeptide--D-alanyl-D-alanine ligase [Bacteroidales bacterium]